LFYHLHIFVIFFSVLIKTVNQNFKTITNIFYTIKFADLIGVIPYCSINAAVARFFLCATSDGVFPYISLAFGSAPASMRALMISSGAPFAAA
jgi:hypothetical protein